MNKTFRILFVFAAFCLPIFLLVFAPSRHEVKFAGVREQGEDRAERLERNERRDLPENDYFLAQRMYPRQALPQNVSGKIASSAATFRKKNSGRSPMSSGAWSLAGPSNVGGRITAIVIHPTDPNIIYAGAASGGVWKTTDFGVTWSNIFSESFSIGSIAMDPANSAVLYVGTGEANPSSTDTYPGNGLWKSTDAGATWVNIGLSETGHIGKIVVNPLNSNTIYVAALGLYRTLNYDRGVYKSTNGGSSWSRILFADTSTGATDLQMSPLDTNRILAATFTYYRTLPQVWRSGTGSAIYLSIDGGASWVKDTIGIPYNNPDLGRISIDISPTSPSIVFALVTKGGGFNWDGVYKSIDAGATWTKVFNNTSFGESQVWYNCIIKVDPTASSFVWAGMTSLYRSTDGTNFNYASFAGSGHADYHAIEFAPSDPSKIVLGNDGGIYLSTDGGASFTKSLNLPITQFYAGTIGGQNPNYLLGGTQDNGSVRSHNSVVNTWSFFHGGDGFYCLVDPTDSNYVYAEYQNGYLEYSIDGGSTFNYGLTGINPAEPVNWSQPIAMDPQHPKTLYTGTNFLYRTTDHMQSWTKISPMLTTGGPAFWSTMSTIDVAPTDSAVVFAGTGDGRLWVTTNTGSTWTNITTGLPNRWVSRVTVDPHSANIAYVTLSGFREYDFMGHLYRTSDFGTTWTDIGTSLPDVPLNDVIVDPLVPNTLYIASDVNVMVTGDLGATWSVLGSGLPNVTVHDLAFHAPSRTLAAFTHGRSVFTYQLPASEIAVDVALRPRWNLISNPVQTSDITLSALYPGSLTRAYSFESGTYHMGDSLQPGRGYWAKFPTDVATPRTLNGFLRTSASIPVVAGWNLIGSISTALPVNGISSIPQGIQTSQFFSFGDTYSPADSILPGHGYWVKASSSGTLELSSGLNNPPESRISIKAIAELPPSVPEESASGGTTPENYSLAQNYPNPFNPSTRIAFELREAGYASLKVYDILGKEVASLVDGMNRAGRHEIEWDATGFPTGVYSYRLVVGEFTSSHKMIMLK